MAQALLAGGRSSPGQSWHSVKRGGCRGPHPSGLRLGVPFLVNSGVLQLRGMADEGCGGGKKVGGESFSTPPPIMLAIRVAQ